MLGKDYNQSIYWNTKKSVKPKTLQNSNQLDIRETKLKALLSIKLVKNMPLFGSNLFDIENRLIENQKKTKAVFPEETRRIEWGLALMRDITQISKDTSKDYPEKPNLFTNHNLFARNRQLLLNAYVCLLGSSYGTLFVILRTVLENNNLMRLFNKKPKLAYEWLPKELQERFTAETKLKYGISGKHDERYRPSSVENLVFDNVRKPKVKSEMKTFYGQLCNYTHPNFLGWQELIGRKGEAEFVLNMPLFSPTNAEKAVGVTLFMMQISFKSFVETFKGYLKPFAPQLKEWQDTYTQLVIRYMETEQK